MTRHQHGNYALFPQTHFLRGEPSGGVARCQLSSQGINVKEKIHNEGW